MSEEAIKRDTTKDQPALVATSIIHGVAQVMTAAVKTGKYPPNNWRKGMAWSIAYNSLQRHLMAWWEGTDFDSESGMSHLYHAACNLMFLIEYQLWGIGKDDRYKGGEHVGKE